MKEQIKLIDNDQALFSGMLNPTGRLRRLYFALYAIIYIVLVFFLAVVGGFMSVLTGSIGMLVTLLLLLGSYIPFFVALVKRYHDFGWSGWVPGAFLIFGVGWSVAISVAYVSSVDDLAAGRMAELPHAVAIANDVVRVLQLIVLFLLPLFMPGSKGFNRYGSNPKRNFAVQCDEAGIAREGQGKEA